MRLIIIKNCVIHDYHSSIFYSVLLDYQFITLYTFNFCIKGEKMKIHMV